jgi:hypothetical protein
MEKYECAPVYVRISVHRHQMPPAQKSLPPAQCAKGVKTTGRRGKKREGREGGRDRELVGGEGRGGRGDHGHGEHLLLELGGAMLA